MAFRENLERLALVVDTYAYQVGLSVLQAFAEYQDMRYLACLGDCFLVPFQS